MRSRATVSLLRALSLIALLSAPGWTLAEPLVVRLARWISRVVDTRHNAPTRS